MAAKEYLESYLYYDAIIKNKKERLENLEAEKFSYGRINYGTERVQSTPNPDKFGQMQVRIEEIREQIDMYQEKQEEILDTIELVGSKDMYNLLYKRYVEDKPLYVCASEMNKAYQTVRNLSKKCLVEIEKLICQ